MTDRETIIDLLNDVDAKGFWMYGVARYTGAKCGHDMTAEDIADYLLENGVTVQEWISVKDRLPDNKEHDWVLAQVVEDNGFMHIPKVMEYRQQKNDWFEETYGWLSEHNGAFTVTHWMPLPEPPKGE